MGWDGAALRGVNFEKCPAVNWLDVRSINGAEES